MKLDDAPDGLPDPTIEEEPQARRSGDSITDFGAVAFVFALFFLGIGLMYLINHGKG